jgi:enoyl-CoA hydratase
MSIGPRVSYVLDGAVATVTMDDGKVNVLSPDMQAEIHAAFDQAAADNAVVILTGREKAFSAGFDLAVLRGGGPDGMQMVKGGFELAERLLSFPRPIVVACPGHAIAMGSFLLLSGDYRVGADGPFRITANEVAIGLILPLAAIELCRMRLTPPHLQRATILSEIYSPATAVEAGFLDQVVAPADLQTTARATAEVLATLDATAHTAVKQRVRAAGLAALRVAIDAEFGA